MNAQERTINRIHESLKDAVQRYNETFGKEHNRTKVLNFEVRDLGVNNIKVVHFETNFSGGSVLTEFRGHLFVGRRGGLKGEVRTLCNSSKVQGRKDLYKVTMWIY